MKTRTGVWVVSRAFAAVPMNQGECPNDERHFRGAAGEVYTYLKLLAKRHGGFVFPSVRNISEHTKNWRNGRQPFSLTQCERILRAFRALGILGRREKRIIHGRAYWGSQFANHIWWAEACGDMCDFKHWETYQSQCHRFMGNNERHNDGKDDDPNEGQDTDNDGANDGRRTIVSAPNVANPNRLQERTSS